MKNQHSRSSSKSSIYYYNDIYQSQQNLCSSSIFSNTEKKISSLNRKSRFSQVDCIKGNQCKHLCTSKNCSQSAIVCGVQDCECREIHHQQLCIFIEPQALVRRVQFKIKNDTKLQNYLSKIIQQAVDWISDFEDKLRFMGLRKVQSDFLQKIYNRQFSKLKPAQINAISKVLYEDLQSASDSSTHKMSEKTVQKIIKEVDLYWKTTFQQVQKQFLHIESLVESIIAAEERSSLSHRLYRSQEYIQQPNITLVGKQIDSRIVSQIEQLSKLKQFIPKQIRNFKLLYRASQNNFQVTKFFEKCSEYKNTVVLIQTQHGNKIGGFTTQAWTKNQKFETFYIQDEQKLSCIFSITNGDKFTLKNSSKALSSWYLSNYGPIFGEDDLTICSNADFTNKSMCLQSGDYQNQKYRPKSKDSYQLFSGSPERQFLIKEWEVFQLQVVEQVEHGWKY